MPMERWESVKNRVGFWLNFFFSCGHTIVIGCSVQKENRRINREEYTIKEEVVGAYYQSFLYYSGVASMNSQVARPRLVERELVGQSFMRSPRTDTRYHFTRT